MLRIQKRCDLDEALMDIYCGYQLQIEHNTLASILPPREQFAVNDQGGLFL